MAKDRGRRVVTGAEAKLWREAMRGTKAFVHQTAAAAADPTLPPPIPPAAAVLASPPPAMAIRSEFRPGQGEPAAPMLDHRRAPGLDKSTAGRFAKGAMDIEATIDLHGLTQPVAHAALARFIAASADLGRRCLLVITGKGNRQGTGVLRAEVPRWLNEPHLRGQILAYRPAQPRHGGDGALYVLLKRRR